MGILRRARGGASYGRGRGGGGNGGWAGRGGGKNGVLSKLKKDYVLSWTESS